MGLDLKDILLGVGVGTGHPKCQRLVDPGSVYRGDHLNKMGVARFKVERFALIGTQKSPRNVTGTGTAYSDDGYAPLAGRSSYRANCIVKGFHLPTLPLL